MKKPVAKKAVPKKRKKPDAKRRALRRSLTLKREHRRVEDDTAQCTADLMKLGIVQETALYIAEAIAVEIAEARPAGTEPKPRGYLLKPVPKTPSEIVWRVWQNARHDVYGFAQAALFLRLVRKPSDSFTDLGDHGGADGFVRDMWHKAYSFNEMAVRRSEAADRRDEAER